MAGNQVTLTLAGDSDQLERALDRVGEQARRMGEQVGTTEAAFDTAARGSTRYGAALDKVSGFSASVADGLDGVAGATQAVGDVMSYSDRKAEELARAQVDVAQAAQDVRQAMADMDQAIRDATQAGIDSRQAGIDLEQALLDQATAQQAYNKAVREHGPNSAEARQAKIDLKQADLDAAQAAEDAKQANEDLKQANLDAAQAAIDQTDANNRLTAGQRELAAQSGTLRKVGEYAGMLSGVLGGLAGVIGTVIAVQWAWNAAMTANPIGLIVVGIGLLIAAIVWIALKTDWFQRLWTWAWGGIKSAASSTWEFIQKIPGWVGSAFSTIGDAVSRPFKSAFNAVARAWNNTVGRLSWSVPNWIPGIGGNTIAAPRLPQYHTGGTASGAMGAEYLAILKAGERVVPPGGVTPADDPGRLVGEFVVRGSDLVLVLKREARNRGGIERMLSTT